MAKVLQKRDYLLMLKRIQYDPNREGFPHHETVDGYPNWLFESPYSRRYLERLFSQNADIYDVTTYRYSTGRPSKVDLVVAGCSFTSGEGTDYSKTWGVTLGKMLGVTYVNISSSGWSMSDIVSQVLNHVHRNGKPKYIAILATELFRYKTAINTKATRTKRAHDGTYEVVTATLASRDSIDIPSKYSVRPHYVEDVLSVDEAFRQSLSAITSIVQFCKAAEIKLVWGTWDELSSEFYKSILSSADLDVDLSGYVELPIYVPETPVENLPAGCHLEDKNLYSDNFNYGTDGKKHAGVHHHAHWGELFYDTLINK